MNLVSPLRPATAAMVLTFGLLIAGISPATAQQPAEDDDVAILDPLLATLSIGNPVGTNLICRTASGTIASGANELVPETSPAVSRFLEQVNAACQQFIELNAAFISAGQENVGPLAAINPAVNPGIQLLAQSLRDSGDSMGTLLFGRTVYQLGDTVAYFATTGG